MKLHTCFLLLCVTASSWAHGPGKGNDFEGRRVLFIGIDGCRADALDQAMVRGLAPHLKALAETGVLTHQIYAGGELDTPTEQPTVSGPGWATLLTGVWHDKHHIINNGFKNNALQRYPHFMRRLKEEKPTAWCASLVSWPAVNEHIVADSQAGQPPVPFVDSLFTAQYEEPEGVKATPDKDIEVRNAALAELAQHDPDVVYLHLGQVDEYGHGAIDPRASFSPDSGLYLHGIAMVDSHIGEILRAVARRPQYKEESWLILVTTDHGGRGNGHGGKSPEERNIWLIASGADVPKDLLLSKPFGQTEVPCLILKHLGVPVKSEWNWEPDPFAPISASITPTPKPSAP